MHFSGKVIETPGKNPRILDLHCKFLCLQDSVCIVCYREDRHWPGPSTFRIPRCQLTAIRSLAIVVELVHLPIVGPSQLRNENLIKLFKY